MGQGVNLIPISSSPNPSVLEMNWLKGNCALRREGAHPYIDSLASFKSTVALRPIYMLLSWQCVRDGGDGIASSLWELSVVLASAWQCSQLLPRVIPFHVPVLSVCICHGLLHMYYADK